MFPKHRRRESGVALIATLMLFLFLVAMIGAALRGNATRRRYLRTRRDGMSALYLAESGVHEALHALASGRATGSLHRSAGRGGYTASWRPLRGKTAAYEITAVGVSGTGVAGSPRRRVRVRVHAARNAPSVAVQSWRPE